MSVAPAQLDAGRSRRAWRNRLFRVAMLGCMFVAFGTMAVLLVDTVITGWPALSQQLLTGLPSTQPDEAGARPAILATLYLGLLVLLFSVPIGVLTAIYLEEYANRERWWNRAVEVNIQNLAAKGDEDSEETSSARDLSLLSTSRRRLFERVRYKKVVKEINRTAKIRTYQSVSLNRRLLKYI